MTSPFDLHDAYARVYMNPAARATAQRIFGTERPDVSHIKDAADADLRVFEAFLAGAAARFAEDNDLDPAQAPGVEVELHRIRTRAAANRIFDAETKDATEVDFAAGIVSGDQLLNLPTAQPMVGTWLDRGMVAQLVGSYGSGKTFVAMELGLSVASGRAWFGQPTHHQGQVLYIAAEGGYTMPDRARGWIADTGRSLPDGFLLYPHRFDITESGLWTPLHSVLAEKQVIPALVILDTRSRLVPGDENTIEPSARLTEACDTIRDLVPDVTIVVVHHPGHGVTGRGRGHSAFEDNLDVVWSLTGRLKDGPVKLTDEKQKARAQNENGMWLTLTTTDAGFPRMTTTAEPVDDEDGGRAIRSKILATVQAHPGRCTVSNLWQRDSPFYVGSRPKVEQTVRSLLANTEVVAREHRHEDTDRKADRLFPRRSLLHNEAGDEQ